MSSPASRLARRGLVAVFVALVGCGGGDAAAPVPLSVLGEATVGTLKVELLAAAPLAMGQNHVFYRVTADGQAVTQATLVQKPLMHMTGMSHSCPRLDPPTAADAEGLFEGMLIFNMASSDTETWELGLEVTPTGASAPTSVAITGVPVAANASKTTLTTGGSMYLVTLAFDQAARVGTNAYTLSIHQPDAMKMVFAPMTDFTVTAVPEMPSMGHGSTGNVDPTHTADGLYRGSVNFSMAGDWKITFTVKDAGGTPLGAVVYTFDL